MAGHLHREKWAMELAAARLCSCGHPMGEHRELPYSTMEILPVDAETTGSVLMEAGGKKLVEVANPAYRAGYFHCQHDGCGCVLLAKQGRGSRVEWVVV